MKSVARPVLCVAPWFQLVVIAATFTPRPTWAGLVPPRFCAAAPPARMTWDSVSWKTVWLPLKPTVLTLAMLLPVTSSLVWWARRPETAENMERSTGEAPQWKVRRSAGEAEGSGRRSGARRGRAGRGGGRGRGARDLRDAAHGDGHAADHRRRLGGVGAEPDGGDRAALLRAGLVGVGDRPAHQRAGAAGALQGEQGGVLGGDL